MRPVARVAQAVPAADQAVPGAPAVGQAVPAGPAAGAADRADQVAHADPEADVVDVADRADPAVAAVVAIMAPPGVVGSGKMPRSGQFTVREGARSRRAPDIRLTRLDFPDVPHSVALHGAEAVARSLSTVIPDWAMVAGPKPLTGRSPVTTVKHDPDSGYQFHSWWADSPLTRLGLAGATCGVVADLLQSHLDSRPGLFGLHAGAIRIGGHLVAFTGAYRAGKTTLVTRLGTQAGCELFCDDILPIEPDGMAVALGVQPRLRLPLPISASRSFRDHVAHNLTVHDDRYGYVSIPNQAPCGTRAPLEALVVLSRQDGAAARFHQLETGDAAAFLIRQNIADPGDMEAHYDRLAAMTERLVCLTLVYSDLEEAVDLLCRTFDAPKIPDLKQAPAPALRHTGPDDEVDPADLSLVFSRTGDVVERVIGGDTFLWQMDGRNFFSLNPVGGAVWALLETPTRGHEIARTLHEAFPDVPAEAIARDVARLLGQMQMRGLALT
jgi:hypothetical protein